MVFYVEAYCAWLQWGHRLSAMDTGFRPRRRSPRPVASMGPPPFSDGYCTKCFFTGQRRPLASMGPPPFSDGYRSISTTSRPRTTCFNGATAFRRWIRQLHLMGTSSPYTLQWGHRLSAMDTLEPSVVRFGFGGFNGATAFRRWIPAHIMCNPAKVEGASMGPPPFGDGYLGFPEDHYPWSLLQWGHRLSAMDTRLHTVQLRTSDSASMGPPPFGDGYPSPYCPT